MEVLYAWANALRGYVAHVTEEYARQPALKEQLAKLEREKERDAGTRSDIYIERE
jgi:hypothetical protein